MAIIYGTPGADSLVGTADDDTIIGYKGKDGINGLGGDDIITGDEGDDAIDGGDGNDTITGGKGADDIDGGAGNDTFIVDDASELAGSEAIEGGTGIDTLVTGLNTTGGDDLDGASNDGVSPTIWGSTIASMTNVELVQVTNASDTILTLGTDSIFAFDGQSRTSTDFGTSGAVDVVAASFTGATNTVTANGVTFNEAAGITIDGTTYDAGTNNTFTTASGGTVTVTFVGGRWGLEYTGPAVDGLAVITAESTVEEQTLSVTATEDGTGNTVSTDIVLNNTFGTTVDLNAQGALTATKVIGSDIGNFLTSGAGNDTLIGNGGSDSISLFQGDNTVWAGATDDSGDTANIYGTGANTVGLGTGDDDFYVFGTGDNTLFGGEGNDDFLFYNAASSGPYGGAEGSNTVWAGVGDDTFTIDGNGTNVLGGGEGADTFNINEDSINTLYLGADDDDDTVTISGNGANTVFGGAGANGTGVNTINIDGTGANTVFNGNGDDIVNIAGTATGANTLWGGAGDDTFNFTTGGVGTVAFAAGNGLDTINGFDLASGATKIDVTELGFTDANDVLNSMSNTTGGDTLLFVEAGQAITFTGLAVVDFQGADPADWLVV